MVRFEQAQSGRLAHQNVQCTQTIACSMMQLRWNQWQIAHGVPGRTTRILLMGWQR